MGARSIFASRGSGSTAQDGRLEAEPSRKENRVRGVYEKVKRSNVWYIRYPNPNAPGKKIRERIGAKDAAEEALVIRRREIRENTWVAPACGCRREIRENRLAPPPAPQKTEGKTLEQVFELMMATKKRRRRQTQLGYRTGFRSSRFDELRAKPI